MEESWKDCIGFPHYRVSDLGHIYSKYRNMCLKYKINKVTGYASVGLTKDKRMYMRYVHILILENFIGRNPLKPIGHHKNENKSNNALTNLEWSTRKDNSLIKAERLRSGLSIPIEPRTIDIRPKRYILRLSEIWLIRRLLETDCQITKETIASMCDISVITVDAIQRGSYKTYQV